MKKPERAMAEDQRLGGQPSGAGDMPAAGIGRRIVRNSAFLITAKGLNGLFGLAYTALAVRALGLEGFGLLVLIHAYVQTVADLTRMPAWQAILRYGTPAYRHGRGADLHRLVSFGGVLDLGDGILGALAAVAGVMILGPLMGWSDDILPAAALYAVSVFFIAPSTPIGLLRLWDRFDMLALRSVAGSLTRLLGAVALLLAGGDLVAFLALWFGATLVSSATLIAGAWQEAARRGATAGFRFSVGGLGTDFPALWRLLWATHANAALATATAQIGTLMIGGILGPASAGLFRIARQIADAIAQPGKLVTPVIYPELAALLVDHDTARLGKLLKRMLAAAAAAAAAGFAVVWLAGVPLLALIGGAGAVAAYDVLLLLAVAALILLATFPLEPVLISAGFEMAALHSRLLMTVVYFPLLVVLLRWQGLEGAAVAAVIAHTIAVAVQAIYVTRWLTRQREGRPA